MTSMGMGLIHGIYLTESIKVCGLVSLSLQPMKGFVVPLALWSFILMAMALGCTDDVGESPAPQRSSNSVSFAATPSTRIIPSPTPEPAKPKSFGDGMWRIGKDIPPGVYAALGGKSCLWHSFTGSGGSTDDIVRIGHPGRPVVMIGPEYRGFHIAGFQSVGCGRWRPIDEITEPVEDITDGTWIVGQEIEPGTYLSTSRCPWFRLSGFNDEPNEVIARNDFAEGKSTVTIESTDAGFMSFGCGGWARVE